MNSLKDEMYYRDRYDRQTVEQCREHVKRCLAESERDFPAASWETKAWTELLYKVSLYFLRGERYAQKSDTIRAWRAQERQRDQQRDSRLERAKQPVGIRCLSCRTDMECVEKDLHDREGLEQVLFFFECPRCHARRAFFENTEEYRVKPTHCKECQGEMKAKSSRTMDGVTITKSCIRCGAIETETFNVNCESEKADAQYITDRNNFCLSEEEGQEYVASQVNAKAWQQESNMREAREKIRPILDEIAKLKKLTIVEAQNLVTRSLERIGFTRVEFGQPTVKTDVEVGFSAQDAKTGRDERESVRVLRHQFSQMLGNTNWKLLSGGVTYRLGILTGRMRGLESEQELIEMVRIRLKSRKSKI